MENQLSNQKDHDSIVTLVADVKSIKDSLKETRDSQEKFHIEVKESFKELKDGFVTRSEYVEVCKIQTDHETRTRNLEESKWKTVGVASTITGILSIAGGYILNLMTK